METAEDRALDYARQLAQLRQELTMERNWRMRLQEELWALDPARDPRCSCSCHDVIQPGLIPCPECNHSSRYAAAEEA